jgi:polyketide biosynthesis 3-hydroxy-3-methylglutaryl-CoA synthase-like enzyme PksG
MAVGIESLNIYCGCATIDVAELAKLRNLNNDRFEKLLMKEKSVPMPWEDAVSNGVNAARPLIDKLTEVQRDSIDMIITCTESGIDFGKSISTYIHHYLKLNRNCRLFELKNACYSGTAGLQTAVNFILSQTSPGKKALVICTDIMRITKAEGFEEFSFVEPSSGSGAVAMLVSDNPLLLRIDIGAHGYYGYEVMDTCRPAPDLEAGNADLSLLSYLDCCENTFLEYQKRVEAANYQSTFEYLIFHTPFGGMVKGAHRTNMRKFMKAPPDVIEADFTRRVAPSLAYCERVGNIMGATVFLALAGAIDNGSFDKPKRVGIFSYGSGCCSEFYSGIVTKQAQHELHQLQLSRHLDERRKLSMEEYESIFDANENLKFGRKNYTVDTGEFSETFKRIEGKNRLILSEIKDYHRIYKWI